MKKERNFRCALFCRNSDPAYFFFMLVSCFIMPVSAFIDVSCFIIPVSAAGAGAGAGAIAGAAAVSAVAGVLPSLALQAARANTAATTARRFIYGLLVGGFDVVALVRARTLQCKERAAVI